MFEPHVFQSLRNGEIVLVQQASNFAVLGKLDSPQYREFALQQKGFVREHVLLLSEIGHLTMYLQKVPELAWDIIEYSEKELEIKFPDGRNVPDLFLDPDKGLAVRIILKGNLHKLLYNLGKPLALTKLSSSFSQNEFLKHSDKMLNLPDNFEWKLRAGKVMELGLGGEIKFHEE